MKTLASAGRSGEARPMPRRRWFSPALLTVAGLLLAGCAGMRGGGVPASSLTLIDGEINGQQTRFVVDSGSPTTLLAMERAPRYKVFLGPQTGMSGGIGGLVPRYAALIDSWSFGHHQGGPTFIQLQPMPFANEFGGPDGLIGLDLLQRLGVVVDYSGRRGYGELLIDLDGEQVAAKARADGWKRVALQRTGDESYHLIEVEVAGQRQQWLVDTGAQRGVIQHVNAERLGVRIKETNHRIIGATGHLARSRQASSVPLTFPNGATIIADLVVLSPGSLGAEAPRAIRHGIVGADVLNALGAIYDIGKAVLYLPPQG